MFSSQPQQQLIDPPFIWNDPIWRLAAQLVEREQQKDFPVVSTWKWSIPSIRVNKRQRNYTVDSGCVSEDSLSCTSSDIEVDIYNEISKHKQIPFRDYVCHRCNKQGHMISDCPTKEENPKTPYQGSNISRGQFKCSCGRKWTSDYVIANKTYSCRQCSAKIYPVKINEVNSYAKSYKLGNYFTVNQINFAK